jgi:hypothetical protein
MSERWKRASGRISRLAQETTAAAQPPGFSEFGGSAISFAFEGIGGGEEGSSERQSGIGAARLFEPKGRLVDARLQQIGRELNVRYVLEGSIRRSGDRVRANAQLIDAETTSHRPDRS